ncbi:DnaA/Hda family protein [Geobacter argillaceus]|uniref:Regulatory inactivation of DnaA Hda protein n=1 Tax=Geobacter argillaceus TaxID=345631 RepID=A0A562V7P3_9BACT|nr:DnaA/Hda family protein [Geobacter argillaceus]TWJ13901.1 regulatory inactivation of DnaA Hda protein [Geobacter argillaceus]
MQLTFDFPFNPRYRFANFVVCPGNRTAFQFARKVADPAESENLLYLYGPAGAGKTHLLMAVGQQLAGEQEFPAVSCGNLERLYGQDEGPERASALAAQFRDAPALLLDDIHRLPADPHLQAEVWQLFNDFYSAGRKIVVTGLVPPKELTALDGHLISRLLWGLVARVDISDDDSRRMIMKKLAEDRQIVLPADVIDYLLIHLPRDIPSLVAALETLTRQAFASQRKITVRLAKEALPG